jgi:hypothetical protein
MGVGLVHRVFGLGRFFLAWSLALLWKGRCPYGPTHRDCQAGAQASWTDAVWPNHLMWGGAELGPSLSEGV